MRISNNFPPDLIKGDPYAVANEYLAARNDMIERHRNAGGVLLGNASKPTQMQFIRMCNEHAARFANQFPHTWNAPHWQGFSRLNRDDMAFALYMLVQNDARPLTLELWEACSELSKTYLALLMQRETS